MKIVTLVENTTESELKTVHGLSLYIETKNHKILFDLGPDETLFDNASDMHIDLSAVDTVVISHGHKDHGGALQKFLEINGTARVYVQRKAFDKHYSIVDSTTSDISLDENLKDHKQVVLLDGNFIIDDELTIFTIDTPDPYYSDANDSLYSDEGKEDFSHEQNLLIKEHKNVLIMGCAHKGVINIMNAAKQYGPEMCIGGFHLFNPVTQKTVSKELLDSIAGELDKNETIFYTCHCTGEEAYEYLSERTQNLHYLSCGTILII